MIWDQSKNTLTSTRLTIYTKGVPIVLCLLLLNVGKILKNEKRVGVLAKECVIVRVVRMLNFNQGENQWLQTML